MKDRNRHTRCRFIKTGIGISDISICGCIRLAYRITAYVNLSQGVAEPSRSNSQRVVSKDLSSIRLSRRCISTLERLSGWTNFELKLGALAEGVQPAAMASEKLDRISARGYYKGRKRMKRIVMYGRVMGLMCLVHPSPSPGSLWALHNIEPKRRTHGSIPGLFATMKICALL